MDPVRGPDSPAAAGAGKIRRRGRTGPPGAGPQTALPGRPHRRRDPESGPGHAPARQAGSRAAAGPALGRPLHRHRLGAHVDRGGGTLQDGLRGTASPVRRRGLPLGAGHLPGRPGLGKARPGRGGLPRVPGQQSHRRSGEQAALARGPRSRTIPIPPGATRDSWATAAAGPW